MSPFLQLQITNHGPWRLSNLDGDSTRFLRTTFEGMYGPAWSTPPGRKAPLALILTAIGALLLVTIVISAIVLGQGSDTDGAGPPAVLPMSRPLADSEMVVARRLRDANWELYRANVGSAAPGRRLTDREGTDSAPVLSPDRKTVIYIKIDKDTGVRTLRVAGAADLDGDRLLFPLPSGCTQPQRPAWNPSDPSVLAIGCLDEAGRSTLRLMRTNGTVVAMIDPPAGLPRTDDVAFSADGRRLGFWASSSNDADDGRLFSVAVAGGAVAGGTAEQILTSGEGEATHDADLAYSPDGKHIAFTRRNGTEIDIMVADTDGGGVRALITGTGHNQAPTWSPKGSRLAYKSDASTRVWPGKPVPRIWVTSSAAAQPRLLWTRKAPEQQSTPAWR